jgi:DNA-binding GntR family transcriptional regulator
MSISSQTKRQPRGKPEGAAKTPAHQNVFEDLRNLILFGEFAPGQALTILGLQEQTGAGMTPVREALRRLTSEHAIDMLGNRRLCVPVLSISDVKELFFIRKVLEPELARRAAERIPDAVIHDLRSVDADLNETILRGDVQGYMRHNYRFHSTLYSNAEAPVIADTVERLWLRFGPSQREMFGRVGTGNLPDRHVEIMEALERREPDAAARATEDDISQGLMLYLEQSDSIDAA